MTSASWAADDAELLAVVKVALSGPDPMVDGAWHGPVAADRIDTDTITRMLQAAKATYSLRTTNRTPDT